MSAALLGLFIAASFGSGDWFGGRASTKASAPAVLFVAQACAVSGAIIAALVVSADVSGSDLAWGAAAGAVNAFGLGLLYHALATHPAAVVAPIAAVVGSAVPVTYGLATGERPSALVLAGIALAMVAAALVGFEPQAIKEGGVAAAGAAQAAIAGLGLGSSLVLFTQTSEDSGQWPVFAARLSAVIAVGLAVFVMSRRSSVQFPRASAFWYAAAAGAADIIATVMLIVAVRQEFVSVVAPLASLAPAITVVLAFLISHERIDKAQRVGLVLALVGLALVAAG